MSSIRILKRGIDVSELQQQLAAHPELWNTITYRTERSASPHRECDDIWLRYNDFANYDQKDPMALAGQHESVWYPASDILPAVKPLCDLALEVTGGARIGGAFITRVPAGSMVYPHKDRSWHADYYESKIGIQVHGNQLQGFHFVGEELITVDGDMFEFNNSRTHWVTNPSREARVTLIVSVTSKQEEELCQQQQSAQ